jgi:7-cyano-7-deazaguanine synthase
VGDCSVICILVSGGVDSSILVAETLRQGVEVAPLYVRAGFIWEKAELFWLRRLLRRLRHPSLRPLTVVDAPVAPFYGDHWGLSGVGVPAGDSPDDSVYLPGRNLILLSQASVFCAQRGGLAVALAILKGNPFPDAATAFLKCMQRSASLALGRRIRLTTPYRRLTKEQVLKRANGFPIELTFSCLKPRGLRHCGACNKCEERFGAINRNNRL